MARLENNLRWGDFWASEGETIPLFYKLLTMPDGDTNLLCYFDPIGVLRSADMRSLMERHKGIYYGIFEEGAGQKALYVGIAAILDYERLRLGWRFFVSLDAKYRKANPKAFESIVRPFVKHYFNRFTDRYLYCEIFAENSADIEVFDGMGGECIGKNIVFRNGKECPTIIYRISREAIG